MNSSESPPQASSMDSFFDSIRRIRVPRSGDRWVGGVAASLAHRWGVDPLIIRGAFLLITLFGGLGLLVYGVAWALLPEASDGRIHLQEAMRGRFDAALAGAILLAIIGLSRTGFWWGSWQDLPFTLGLVAFIALAVVVVQAIRKGKPTPPADVYGPAHPESGPFGPETATDGVPSPPATSRPAASTDVVPSDTATPPTVVTTPMATTEGTPPLPTPDDRNDMPATHTAESTAGRWSDHTPPQPPQPPKPVVPGPGAPLVRITFGLILLAVAGLLYVAHTESGNAWSPTLVAVGTATALFGVGSAIAGMMGRRAGSLGVVGTLAAIVAVPWAMIHSSDVVQRYDWTDVSSYSDTTWSPSTAASAAGGKELTGGELTVNLFGLEGVAVAETIDVDLGAGQVILQVPKGMPVQIDASVYGEVDTRGLTGWSAEVDGEQIETGTQTYGRSFGSNRDFTFTSPKAGGPETITVDVDVEFGTIIIEELPR